MIILNITSSLCKVWQYKPGNILYYDCITTRKGLLVCVQIRANVTIKNVLFSTEITLISQWSSAPRTSFSLSCSLMITLSKNKKLSKMSIKWMCIMNVLNYSNILEYSTKSMDMKSIYTSTRRLNLIKLLI